MKKAIHQHKLSAAYMKKIKGGSFRCGLQYDPCSRTKPCCTRESLTCYQGICQYIA